MSDQKLDRVYQQLHAHAAMLLARSKIDRNPNDPYHGYRDLANFVHKAMEGEGAVDFEQVYLRLLAACKAERTALPTLAHMQALMSMVWAMDIHPQYEQDFSQVCQRVNEALCYEIGTFATDSMKSVAATLHVDLQVQMGYAEEADPPAQQEQASAEAPAPPEASKEPVTVEGNKKKPTLH